MSLLTLLIARLSAVLPAKPAASLAPGVPAALSLDDQMHRLHGVVSASIERTAATGRYHAAAEDQLDAATYALRELMKDLSAVMTIPPLRTGAALYQLPQLSAPQPSRRRAAAA